MKVAMIVPGGMDRSGTHRVIPCLLWLLERLAPRNDLHVFAMRGEPRPGRWELRGADVHNVGKGRRFDSSTLRTLHALVREHRRHPFDVLHAFWASGPGVVAALARPAVRAPVLLHVEGGDLAAIPEIGYGGLRNLRGRALVRLALAAATRRTATSGPLLAAAAGLGYPACRLPLGVSLDAWRPRPPRPRRPDEPARLVSVGSLNRVKDQALLLRAFATVVEAGLDATLDVVGADTLGGETRRLAARLGLQERVRFHGFLTQTELRPVVEAAHVMVVSSRHEGAPVAVLEAAVVGVPTVGTAVGHVADWAPEAAVAGPVGDADALADGVVALLRDDERRVRIAERAQAHAVERDADWTAARVARHYEELVGHRTDARGAA